MTLDDLPDDALMPVRWIREQMKREAKRDGPEWVSTTQAAQLLGFAPKRWRIWAEDGRIPDAWKDEADHWRLPLAECRRHLLRLKAQRTGNRTGERGPYKKARTTLAPAA
ncbi:MAG TPA: hypothetical protein VKD22_10490 [Ramlibacter sp.]|nr:hypothetical protein [Ramlibacter sp.]